MKTVSNVEVLCTTETAISDSAIRQIIRTSDISEIKQRIYSRMPSVGYYTWEALAEAVHISRQFLSRALNGKTTLPPSLLQSIADLLSCDIRYLLGIADPEKEKAAKTHADLLREYVLSFGIEYTLDGNPFLRDNPVAGCNFRYMINEQEFENFLEYLDNIVSKMVEYQFFFNGKDITLQNIISNFKSEQSQISD